jgi:YebC/PmpR family DNA-binding regulatory protein
MPNDTIERSIKKAAGDINAVNFEPATYEGYGPKGAAIIVKVLTDNKNRAAANVRNAFTKGNGNLGTSGCVSFMFDQKGQIIVEAEAADEEELMLLAIEAGAEQFNAIDSGSDTGYEIITTPEDFPAVRQALESGGIAMINAEITMIPQTTAELTDPEDIKKMSKLLDLLDNEDDVQAVYHNGIF